MRDGSKRYELDRNGQAWLYTKLAYVSATYDHQQALHYAYRLLQEFPGDRQRAIEALTTILKNRHCQFDERYRRYGHADSPAHIEFAFTRLLHLHQERALPRETQVLALRAGACLRATQGRDFEAHRLFLALQKLSVRHVEFVGLARKGWHAARWGLQLTDYAPPTTALESPLPTSEELVRNWQRALQAELPPDLVQELLDTAVTGKQLLPVRQGRFESPWSTLTAAVSANPILQEQIAAHQEPLAVAALAALPDVSTPRERISVFRQYPWSTSAQQEAIAAAEILHNRGKPGLAQGIFSLVASCATGDERGRRRTRAAICELRNATSCRCRRCRLETCCNAAWSCRSPWHTAATVRSAATSAV